MTLHSKLFIFGSVLIMVVIVVVFAMMQQKSDTPSTHEQQTSEVPEIEDKTIILDDEAFKTYTDEYLSFKYPSDWEVVTSVVDDPKSINTSEAGLYVVSPNVVIQDTIEGLVSEGYVLEVARRDVASSHTVEEISRATEVYGDLIEEMTVGSLHFILYDFNSEGSSIHAENTTPGVGLTFILHTAYEDNKSPAVWGLMREIVSSVEIL